MKQLQIRYETKDKNFNYYKESDYLKHIKRIEQVKNKEVKVIRPMIKENKMLANTFDVCK